MTDGTAILMRKISEDPLSVSHYPDTHISLFPLKKVLAEGR